jgi:hypothetical protein
MEFSDFTLHDLRFLILEGSRARVDDVEHPIPTHARMFGILRGYPESHVGQAFSLSFVARLPRKKGKSDRLKACPTSLYREPVVAESRSVM